MNRLLLAPAALLALGVVCIDAAAAHSFSPPCSERNTAADDLADLVKAETRFVIIGEIHGTEEIPAFVSAATCRLAETRPVTVALEIHHQAQPDIDAFLDSEGDATAREKLLQGPAWALRTADGRSSAAVLQLLDQLRRMKQAGLPVVVAATRAFAPEGLPQAYSEIKIASAWTDAAGLQPNGIVLAVVGRVHASRVETPRLRSAASLLPPEAYIAISIGEMEGSYWGCGERDCGVQALPDLDAPQPVGVTLVTDDDRFDGYYIPAEQLTASPPAVEAD